MQKNIIYLLDELFKQNLLLKAIFSDPRDSKGKGIKKITVKPIQVKGKLFYQISEQIETQAVHRNLTVDQCLDYCMEMCFGKFKQVFLYASNGDYHVLFNKKGEATLLKKGASNPKVSLVHNRSKNYVLQEGEPIPFLVELEVMKADGTVLAKKRDKFRQINRFLEMVEDVVHYLPEGKQLRVVDFGCGKAYLTFALYHFLHNVKGLDVQLAGLDLKEEVLANCQEIADRLGCRGLTFKVGDIAHYQPEQKIDMVVALHACDIATDAALQKAILWEADVILSAPCCQHELYNQVKSEPLQAILEYGALKERLAALATDAARAQILEMRGYKTQILEFIDSEHTPKNLLIRAVKGNSPEAQRTAGVHYQALKSLLHITPWLEKILV